MGLFDLLRKARRCTAWNAKYLAGPVVSIATGKTLTGFVMQRVWNGQVQYREPTDDEARDCMDMSAW